MGYVENGATGLRSGAQPQVGVRQPPVRDNLDEMLGERLMPLRVRQGDVDEPYLLAVDASGQPVVVEVTPLLDEVALLAALRHAGHAAQMSTRDLAAAYSGGADRFASHLAAFRLTVPSTALLATFVRGGARLLIVCTVVDDAVAETVEFLLQPGHQVEVLHMDVRQDAEGRRVAELSPLEPGPPPVRTATPGPQRPVPVRNGSVPVRNGSVPVRNSVRNGVLPARTGGANGRGSGQVPHRSPRAHPVVRPPSFASPVPSGLAGVGAAVGPVALVWAQRSGACFEALLHVDGTLELTDGTRYRDPDDAARAVSGIRGWMDGWGVWRVGSTDGPSLGDLASGRVARAHPQP